MHLYIKMPIKLSQIATLTVLTGILLVAFQNCGSAENSSLSKSSGQGGVTAEELEQRLKAIEDLAEQDLRCTSVSECAVLPAGSRGCGGPSTYLVTSNLNVNLTQIQSLLAELETLAVQYNQDNQLVSTCEYLMPPQVACQLSLCKTTP